MTRPRSRSLVVLLLSTSLAYVGLVLPLLHTVTHNEAWGGKDFRHSKTPSLTLIRTTSTTAVVDAAAGTELLSSSNNAAAVSLLPLGRAKILYVGEFGLGHRLSKLTGAYDLARRHNLTLVTDWGYCDEARGDERDGPNLSQVEIFHHLFGGEPLWQPPLPPSQSAHLSTSHRIVVVAPLVRIRNDVPGYYAGQMYKNARVPLTANVIKRWYRKMDGDLELFRRLEGRFRFNVRIQEFLQQHHWGDHFVVGLHLRAGNGERDHFVQSQRGITDESLWVRENLSLVHQFLQTQQHTKPPALFLATDTPRLVDVVQRELASWQPSLSLWLSPSQLPKNGVSFVNRGSGCLRGWEDSWMDATLLASSDALVAGARSTFTQILPRARVLDRGGTYCEAEGPRMTCFRDPLTWLLRNATTSNTAVSTTLALNSSDHAEPVLHKVMVHLPEPDLDAEERLPQLLLGKSTAPVLKYGERFASKYRNFKFIPNWTYPVD